MCRQRVPSTRPMINATQKHHLIPYWNVQVAYVRIPSKAFLLYFETISVIVLTSFSIFFVLYLLCHM